MWLTILSVYLVVGFTHNFIAMVIRQSREPKIATSTGMSIAVIAVQVLMFLVGWILWPFALAATIQDLWRWHKG